jgi:FixJ family two-component response regulator
MDKFTVYLVDDDAGVLKALSRLLRAKGYEVKSYEPVEFLHNTIQLFLAVPCWMFRCRASIA